MKKPNEQKTEKQYKVSLTKEEIKLLLDNGHKTEAGLNGKVVTKKTYMIIQKLLASLKRKAYFSNTTL